MHRICLLVPLILFDITTSATGVLRRSNAVTSPQTLNGNGLSEQEGGDGPQHNESGQGQYIRMLSVNGVVPSARNTASHPTPATNHNRHGNHRHHRMSRQQSITRRELDILLRDVRLLQRQQQEQANYRRLRTAQLERQRSLTRSELEQIVGGIRGLRGREERLKRHSSEPEQWRKRQELQQKSPFFTERESPENRLQQQQSQQQQQQQDQRPLAQQTKASRSHLDVVLEGLGEQSGKESQGKPVPPESRSHSFKQWVLEQPRSNSAPIHSLRNSEESE